MFPRGGGFLLSGMWCSAGWSTTGRTRLGRFIETSSTSMTWGLVEVEMSSTFLMRQGSRRSLLGLYLLGGVSLVVSVRSQSLGSWVLCL